MYGWRGRLGLIVPSSNTTMEMELHDYLPEGVSLHTARVPLRNVTGAREDEHFGSRERQTAQGCGR